MAKRAIVIAMLFVVRQAFAASEPAPVVLLWPNGAPGSEGKTDPEKINDTPTLTGAVTNVHKPSLIVYRATSATGTGAAVVVIPGGGHRLLAIEHEGYAVGRWLAERRVSALVLKYPLPRAEGAAHPGGN